MHLIKLVVLGAPGCGKTSLVKQFVQHNFDEEYRATESKQLYYPTVLMDERLYELQIVDLPPITFVPRNSYEEWNHFRGYGLRNAHAYLLVFDITSAQSFQTVKSLRDQLCAMKTDPVIVIAGNKQDLLVQEDQQLNVNNNNPNANGSCSTGDANHLHYHHPFTSHNNRHQSGAINANENRLSTSDLNKEFAAIARKQWKCSYVECSAKFNWRVTAVFSALMKAASDSDDIQAKKQGASHAQGNNNNRKCTIL